MYSRINTRKSPVSSAEPRLMSHVGSVGQDQCASATRAVEVPVLVCLRSSCSHVTGVGGP